MKYLHYKHISLVMIALFSMKVNANLNDDYFTEFKHAKFAACDKIFHQLENNPEYQNMTTRDYLVADLATCWRRSMNLELDKRLLTLKNQNVAEFHAEMDLQKVFNQATEDLCNKDCGSNGMRGISYNFCRVDAYKYRITQATQINHNKLSVVAEGPFAIAQVRKDKIKDTKVFKNFIEKLCALPKSVWKSGNVPVDCQKEVYNVLNNYEFTDDVCDLS